MTVLLIPKLSPRSSSPRAKLSGSPFGVDTCRLCTALLELASLGGIGPFEAENERPLSPCRGRLCTGGDMGGGTSSEIPSKLRFACIIATPVVGVGDICNVKAWRMRIVMWWSADGSGVPPPATGLAGYRRRQVSCVL